jgi:1-acylglycerone phosphate reductase
MFETNVISLYTVSQSFLPLLLASRNATIANIASIGQFLNPPWQSAYAATKAAVASITDTMRLELEPLGINVVTVYTGGVNSNLFANMVEKLPEGSIYEPIRKEVEGSNYFIAKQMPADKYAKAVVDDLMRARPKAWIWHGTFTTFSKWIYLLRLLFDAPRLLVRITLVFPICAEHLTDESSTVSSGSRWD